MILQTLTFQPDVLVSLCAVCISDNSGGKIILSDDQYADTTIRINITSTTSKLPLLSSTGFASSGTARLAD